MDPRPENYADFERLAVIDALIASARDHIANTYGTGHNDGSNPRSFHNLVHTDAVINAVKLLAQQAANQGEIPRQDIPLFRLAAAYHDYIYAPGYDSEQLSLNALLDQMNSSSFFTENDRNVVSQMILATKMQFDGVTQVYSQRSDLNIYGQIMADADLAHLGGTSQEFWDRYIGFMRELKNNPNFTLSDLTASDLASELLFLQANPFKTSWAATIFTQRQANQREVAGHLEILRSRIPTE